MPRRSASWQKRASASRVATGPCVGRWQPMSTLDLGIARAARGHAAALRVRDPAELLQDLLAVRDAPTDLLRGLGREQQRRLRHEDRRLALGIVEARDELVVDGARRRD